MENQKKKKMFSNIIRIESVRVIDSMVLQGFDIVADGGISSRGVVDKQHDEIYLILFNKWKILIRKTIK